MIENCGADIVFLQETKCDSLPPEIERISAYPFKKLFASKDKKGHSGVALWVFFKCLFYEVRLFRLSREKPLKFKTGFGDKRFDGQGRFVHAEYEDFHVINTYVPNSGRGLVNLKMRKEWEDVVLEYLKELDKDKPVIYGGDLNVAHNEIGKYSLFS